MGFARRTLLGLFAALPLLSRPAIAQDDSVPPPDGPAETVEDNAVAHANVDKLRRYYRALNRGDIEAAIAFFAPDTRNHGKSVGRPGLRRVLTDLRAMFPDYHHDLVEVSATGNVVVSRNRVSGTHKGVGHLPVEGGMLVGLPPTNRPFLVQHIHWWRFEEGLIAEHYACRDDLDMMHQLGLLRATAT